jgi:hypothetical protein
MAAGLVQVGVGVGHSAVWVRGMHVEDKLGVEHMREEGVDKQEVVRRVGMAAGRGKQAVVGVDVGVGASHSYPYVCQALSMIGDAR